MTLPVWKQKGYVGTHMGAVNQLVQYHYLFKVNQYLYS